MTRRIPDATRDSDHHRHPGALARERFRLAGAVLALAMLTGLLGCGDGKEAADAEPGTPEWFAGQVLYQITVPEFSDDGTLAGVIPRLDELADLGINVLVFNPIHPAGGAMGDSVPAHPYAVRDHLAVDPALGTLDDFERLVAAAHDRGMRVILDMVLNHGALDHVELRQHPEWFTRDAQGQPLRKVEAWQTAVDFDHGHAGARAYLQRVLRTWAQRGADGFRCLHANLQDAAFWTESLAAARRARPGLYFVADSKDPRHLDEGFDAILRPQYLEASSFAYLDDVAQPGLQVDMWFAISDTVFQTSGRGVIFLEDRFSKRAAETFPWPRGAGYAAGLLTLPGHPQLYNGQEWGSAQQARLYRSVPLDRTARHEGWEALYGDLLALRAASPALRRGDARRLETRSHEILVFTRELAGELMLVGVNLSGSGPEFTLPDELASRRWHEWNARSFATTATELPDAIHIEPFGWRAWRAAR